MTLFFNTRGMLCMCIVAMGITACGGSSSLPVAQAPMDPLIAGTDVPTSSTTTAAGAAVFVKMVVESSANAAEPLVLGDAVLATTDTEEPDSSV